MLTKITLDLEEEVVLKAESYAQKKNRSVSEIVEDYLASITSSECHVKSDEIIIGRVTSSITGMFVDEYKGQSYKELLESALIEDNE